MKYFAVIFLFVCSTAANGEQEGPTAILPNIDFIGRGYDIFRAVPRPTAGNIDPGYMWPVVQMMKASNYEAGKTSNDGRYLIPDSAEVIDCLSCRFTVDVQTIQNSYEYAKTYEDKVEKGSSIKWTSGQASPDFGNVAHTTSVDQRTLVDASLSCIVYCAELPLFAIDIGHLNKDFVKAVAAINTTMPDTINEFLHKFGTHLVYSAKMGSAYWQRSTYHNLDWSKAVSAVKSRFKRAMEIEAASKHEWSDITPDELEMARKLKSYATERFTQQIGASFSLNNSWISETRKNPMPVAMSVVPVSDLLRRRVFPNDELINDKREAVSDFIVNGAYCNFLYEKLGKKGEECKTDNALLPQAVPRFVGNPKTLDTCSEGARMPAFGGIFVDGSVFPTVKNYKSGRSECVLKYKEHAAVSIVEYGQRTNRVMYCVVGGEDQEGLFGGISAETFYVGDCGTSNGGNRYYRPFPTDLVRFSAESVPVLNPYTGKSESGCPKGFQRHPLASLTVSQKTTPRGTTCRMAVNVFVCFNPIEHYDGAFLGGFYTTWDSDKYTKIDNPITKEANCPRGYSAHLLILGTEDGPHKAYVCVINGAP